MFNHKLTVSSWQVVKAYDHKNGNMVAIKIIRNKKRFHHQALVEVKLLDLLRRKVCKQKSIFFYVENDDNYLLTFVSKFKVVQ